MADKVKHWPSWAKYVARDKDGVRVFYSAKPTKSISWWRITDRKDEFCVALSDIYPDTPWDKSLQRSPE